MYFYPPPHSSFIQGVEFDSCIDLIELILMVLLPELIMYPPSYSIQHFQSTNVS
jgi:hypothetical protein